MAITLWGVVELMSHGPEIISCVTRPTYWGGRAREAGDIRSDTLPGYPLPHPVLS